MMTRLTRTFLLLALLCLSPALIQAQDVTSDLLGRVNGLRASLGLHPYSLNGTLSAAAQNHAQWMAETGNISHNGPGGSTPTTRAAALGYSSRFVSENIYGGTHAGVNDAWTFWINSPIHYRGLTNNSYAEIGIGSASTSWGRTFVLVFGTQGNPAPSNSGNTGNNNAAPPVFIVGYDDVGNIMHEIQPSQTLGDIALLYGYTWDDIPTMLQLNELGEDSIRQLPIGGVFLIPPKSGTYTPTPLPPGVTLTASPEPTAELPAQTGAEDLGILGGAQGGDLQIDGATFTPTITLFEEFNMTATAQALLLPSPTPTPTVTQVFRVATAANVPDQLQDVANVSDITSFEATVTDAPQVAVAATSTPDEALADSLEDAAASVTATPSPVVIIEETQQSPLLLLAVGVQGVIIVGAAVEFVRRMRR